MKNTQRLDKLLANFGFGSRSEIKKMARNGLITVDSTVVNDASTHVDPEKAKFWSMAER